MRGASTTPPRIASTHTPFRFWPPGRPANTFAPFGSSIALGPGPVYPVVDVDPPYDPAAPAAHVALDRSHLPQGGWYAFKALWIIRPSYRGPVLIRGGRIDSHGQLRFDRDANPSRVIVIARQTLRLTTWRNRPSATRLRGPGCYAYQIDGLTFSKVIVFRADW